MRLKRLILYGLAVIPSERALGRLRKGVAISGGTTAPAKVKLLNVKTKPTLSKNKKVKHLIEIAKS